MQTLWSQTLADRLKERIKKETARLVDDGRDPQLAVVLVGSHPDSLRYISIKTKVAQELGIILSLYHLEEDAPSAEVEETLRFLSDDPEIDGIIVQLPLPEHFTSEQTDALLGLIDPDKDVDGLRGDWQTVPVPLPTLEALSADQPHFLPPLVASVASLLDFYGISPVGKKVEIIGRGRLVGTPLAHYFSKVGTSAENVDEETDGILEKTSRADIVIAGTGEKDLVTYQWIKPGAVVIDCAEDVHADSVSQVACALAPSRGGVGPLTVVWLLHNTVRAARRRKGGS